MNNHILLTVAVGISFFPACCARAAEAKGPKILSVQTDTNQVGRYEKLELRIALLARFTNPYNPDEIDVGAVFVSPSGKEFKIWGFYNPTSSSSLWMVRFAPTEVGVWKYSVHVTDGDGSTASAQQSFTVVPSTHHGFVTIAPNQRYLRFSDGASFYPIGLWYNDAYTQFNAGRITEQALDELQELGVNFIAFYPTLLETLGTGLGRYDSNRCGRLDELFEWCEARDIHVSWNLWFHSNISEAVWGGSNARYRSNPYRLVTPAEGFFGSAQAWQYQQRLYRYIIARWGYSRALYLWFVVDEINGTEGWTKGDQKVALQWCRKVDTFFNTHDPYQRPTTGTQSGGIGQWWPAGYEIFDIASREIYEAQGHPMPKTGKEDWLNDNPLRYSYLNYARQVQALRSGFAKPAIIGECGWDHTYYEPGMPGYLATYHNVLWATLANGISATPFWWSYSDRTNDAVVTNQLRSFARFVADIDFANADFAPATIDAGPCDAWALQSKELTFGWIVNPRVSVANEKFTLTLLPDGDYRVRLYRTWRGRYVDEDARVRQQPTVTCRDGKLTVTIPELKTARGHANHIGNDVAFKLTRIKKD